MRTAIYARVSSDEQAKKATSIPVQVRECEEFIIKHSLGEVFRVYRDEGYSGTNINRPAFLQMAEDGRNGRFDKVVVFHVDRWGRSVADLVVKEELQNLGVRFGYFMQNKPDDDGTDLGIQIEELQARNYSKTLAKRVSYGQRERVRQGRIGFGGRIPYGYKDASTLVDGRKVRAWEPDEDHAPVVEEIFRRYAAGDSIRKITDWLNATGIRRPKNGTRWHPPQVHNILRCPFYVGDLVIGRRKLVKSRNGVKTSKRVTDESAWEVFRGALPAIVDRETFDTVTKRAKLNQQFKPSHDHPGNALSQGLGKCLRCGGPIGIEANHSEKSGKKRQWYFFCRNYRQHKFSPIETCGQHIRVDTVMRQVRASIALFLAQKPDALRRAIADFNRRSQNAGETLELRAARKALHTAERECENFVTAIGIGGDIPALAKALREAQERAKTQRQTVSDLEAERKIAFEPIDADRYVGTAKELLERMNDGPIPKDLLSGVIFRVIIDFRKQRKVGQSRIKQLTKTVSNVTLPTEERRAAAEELAKADAQRDIGSCVNVMPRFEADRVPESVTQLIA